MSSSPSFYDNLCFLHSETVVDTVTEKHKRPRRSIDMMKDFLGDAFQKREQAAERRHKEKIEVMHRGYAFPYWGIA